MKRSKKLISVLLVFAMLTLLLTGCTTEEQKLYGLMKEIGSIEASQEYGEISLDIEQIPQELLAEMGAESAVILEALQNYSLIYEMKQDVRNMNAELVLFIYDKVNETKLPFISAISDGERVYVKVDDMVNLMKDFFKDENVSKELDDLFGGAQYIEMENEEIIDFYVELFAGSSQAQKQALKGMLEQALDQEAILKQQEEMKAFMNPFMEKAAKVYGEFETVLVTEEENKLVLSVGTPEIIDLAKDFINYSIDHAEEVAALLKEIVPVYLEYIEKQMQDFNQLQSIEVVVVGDVETVVEANIVESAEVDFEEMPEIKLQREETVAQMNAEIDEFFGMIKGNEEAYKAMVTAFIDPLKEQAKNTAGNTNLKVVFEKTEDNTYTTVTNLKVDITKKEDRLAFSITINDTVKALESFEVTKPTENIMDGEVYFQIAKDMMNVQKITVEPVPTEVIVEVQ